MSVHAACVPECVHAPAYVSLHLLTCVRVFVHEHVRACIYVYICAAYVCICVNMCECVYDFGCIQACPSTHVQMCVCA